MQKQKALCTAETLIATAKQNLFLPICNRNYLIWILVQICVILALKINIYWLYKYSPLILISTSKYFHLCDIFQSLVLIISHLYRNKQKKKKKGVEFSLKRKPQCWQRCSVRTEEGCVIWCELIKDINSMMNRASLLRLFCKFTFWFYFWVKIRKYIFRLYWTQILINLPLNHALIGFMNIFSDSALVHRKNLTHHVASEKEIRYQNQLNFIHILPNYNSYLKVLYIAT